ncbi:MAG: helix-turn-helix domain-containing protein [Anaerolineaceae bacterium]|nr:helix-turn-helix domain-containing protein [Anaerolineaceae bacterium]
MTFVFDSRPSNSALVEGIWRTQHAGGGSFTSMAGTNMEIVVTKQEGKTWITVRGPETQSRIAGIPSDAEFFGIILKMGSFMVPLPASDLLNGGIELPEASSKSVWLHGEAWEIPTFDNADTFIENLVRDGILAHEPVVESALKGELPDLSLRSVQRRFLRSTGLTFKTVQQIRRAHQALAMLQKGTSIMDTTYDLGYFDQSHLTNSLKYFIGQTPAQILQKTQAE